jgi:colicin import membrane protein
MAAAGSLSPTLALAHDALLPRAPGGMGSGAALALVVHVGLILALTTAVDWRTETPPPVSAELWASVPQSAPLKTDLQTPPLAPVVPTPAPPPPAPVPAPVPAPAPVPVPAPVSPAVKAPEPDIAIEKAAREKAEKAAKADLAKKKLEADALAERERVATDKRQRAEAEKVAKAEKAQAEKAKTEKAQADKEAREAAAEDARLAKQREENLKRMMGQAGGATGRGGSATQDAAPSAAYAGKVAARIRRELVFTGNVPESAEAEVFVASTAIGTILNRRISKSSGYKDWDEAVLRAVDKTGTLPRDVDGRVPKEMTLVFSRRDR